MLFFSIVMIPLALLVCIGLVCSIGILADMPSTSVEEGDQPENHADAACPVELVRLH